MFCFYRATVLQSISRTVRNCENSEMIIALYFHLIFTDS